MPSQQERQGFRRIDVEVPDTSTDAFCAEARRQSAAVAASPHAESDQAFVDAISSDEE